MDHIPFFFLFLFLFEHFQHAVRPGETARGVDHAHDDAEQAQAQGKVISCLRLPDQQDAAYRESVLPSDVLARVAIEALHADYWYKYVGLDGRVVGMTSFGESAPAGDLMEYFGFTVDNVASVVEDVL